MLDWVEPYDIGNAREIFGSFMPGKPLMTTVFEQESNPARRRLWHLLLGLTILSYASLAPAFLFFFVQIRR